MSTRILAAWQSFERAVIPPEAPPLQHEECRRAFYAGAAAMFSLVADVGEDAVSEEAGVQMVAALNQELRAYMQDLERLDREGRRS